MSALRSQFEKELKNKLALKCSGYTTEETVLLKAFKYFDLDNSGCVSVQEFIKAINKIGITGVNEENLEELFKVYDVDGSGELDYKEFTGIVFGHAEQPKEKPQQPAEENKPASSAKAGSKQAFLEQKRVQEILLRIRKKLAKRGVRGICSIAKNFGIIDDDNSHLLDYNEFIKACKDFRFKIPEEELQTAFNAFDRDNNGTIEYDEFLRTIRGEMNDFRRGLVEKAFNILDKDKSGVIDINEIKDVYNALKHPDVINGKKSEDEVLMEFLETFESTHNYLNGNECDGNVSLDEFIEYYENVSMSIDDDAYFELMMNNCWRMGEHTTYNNEKKGWTNKKKEDKKLADEYNKKFEGSGKKLKQKKEEAPAEVPAQAPAEPKKGRTLGPKEQKVGTANNAPFGTDNEPVNYSTSNNPKGMKLRAGAKNMPFSDKGDDVLVKFRQILAERGTRGIMSIRRAFMIADDDNSKSIDMSEFKKFCHDYRIDLEKEEIKKLFEIFDRNHDGTIDYDEFTRNVVGQMNDNRLRVVKKCFDILDKNGNGVLEVDDIKGTYSAKNHPDVLAGKKTENEVLGEFLDTFEYHFSLLNMERTRDQKITFDEFVEYYNNISMSIDTDEYFEAMMTAAYKLDGRKTYAKAWKGEY